MRRTVPDGLAEWLYHGRLVARQLDDDAGAVEDAVEAAWHLQRTAG